MLQREVRSFSPEHGEYYVLLSNRQSVSVSKRKVFIEHKEWLIHLHILNISPTPTSTLNV